MIQSRLSVPRLLLMAAEVVTFVVLCIVATGHFGWSDGAKITAAFAVAYIVPSVILHRARGTSLAAQFILLLLAILLIYTDYGRLVYSSSFEGYSLAYPKLRGDDYLYYKYALSLYDSSVECEGVIFPGLSWFMLGLWKLFGLSEVWPYAMNMMFTLMTVTLTGMTTRRLLSHRVKASPQVLVAGGILLTCMLTYHVLISSRLIKEGPISLAMAMAGFALASMATCELERRHLRRDFILFTIACLMTALVRTTYLYFILVGLVLMTLPHWRRDWRMSAGMLIVFGLSFLFGNYLSAYSVNRHAEIVGGGWNMQRIFVSTDSQAFYRQLLDYYFLYSPWHKLLMLPLTLSVQFIIPFPWVNYPSPHIITSLARFTYGWYFVGGTALFYYLRMMWRKSERIGIWPWWAAICYACIAYIMAGSMARYTIPVQPLFIPVAMYVLCRLHEGHWRKAYTIWMIILVLLITATLLLCLEIQRGAVSSFLHTEPWLPILRSWIS